MTALVDSCAPYVPMVVRRSVAVDPRPLTAPVCDEFSAVGLSVDISGFTPLTERLAEGGPAGAEQLSIVLDGYFGELIALIERHGGDVERFAGDAVTALWLATEDQPLPLILERAAQCALVIQRELGGRPLTDGRRLTLRVAVGVGETVSMQVGGVDDHWDLLLAGPLLDQVAIAEHEARPGEVVLSSEAARMLGAKAEFSPVGLGAIRLESLAAPPAPRAAASPLVTPEAEARLLTYVPPMVRSRLTAGQSGWLSELRRITAVFVNLPDIGQTSHGSGRDRLERCQTVITTLQRIVGHYEGALTQLGLDSKGISAVIAFGLPSQAHENDALRALRAALDVQGELRILGVRCGIGVATGRVFCGTIGSNSRREYTICGDTINRAARLMQSAPGDLLCDSLTRDAAETHLQFEALPPLQVKGKVEPLVVYRPYCVAPTADGLRPMFGRETESRLLTERLEALQAGNSGVVVIEGEAGIGKSRLLADLKQQGLSRGIGVLQGAGDSIAKSTPYHAWRGVFVQLFGLEGIAAAEQRRRRIQDRLGSETPWVELAPLLAAVVSADLRENETTIQMSGQVRADNTHDLLLHLLEVATREAPLTIVIEDAHWLDSASWTLLLLATQRVRPLLLVIATRPFSEMPPSEYRRLSQAEHFQHCRLEALPAQAVLDLVCQRLGVVKLPPSVASLILERAQGNPFFSEELAFALRDAGVLAITGGTCFVAPHTDLATVALPESVEGVITSRMDRLTPSQQLTVKVASIIGRVFAIRVLRDIYPLNPDREQIPAHLGLLEHLDLALPEPAPPDGTYAFKHVITQEVAYNLMLFAHRRQLHRAVAEWYERQEEDLSPYYPLLAHHWRRADDFHKTIDYLEKAGEQALRSGAYQEAIQFLGDALELSSSPRVGDGPEIAVTRRARWERQLGDAFMGIGELRKSRAHSEQSLALLGRRVPTNALGLALGLLREVATQALHLAFPNRVVAQIAERRGEYGEAALAYERIGHLSYYTAELPLGVFASLSCLNLAERGGPSAELARAYAIDCVAASVLGFERLARRYGRFAEAIASNLEDTAALAWVMELTGLFASSNADWRAAYRNLSRAVEVSHRLGDWRRWEESLAQLTVLNMFQGRFADAAEQARQMLTTARHQGHIQAQSWALAAHATSLVRIGHPHEAVALTRAALELRSDTIGRTEAIWMYGALALSEWRRGQTAAAADAATHAVRLVRGSPPTANYTLDACACIAETFLGMWEAQPQARDIARNARRACSALERYARAFPAGQARALIWRGLALSLDGKHSAAHRRWQKGLSAARRLFMPYDEALARFEIGRHLRVDDPARGEHLARALDLFNQMGAASDAARVRSLLRA